MGRVVRCRLRSLGLVVVPERARLPRPPDLEERRVDRALRLRPLGVAAQTAFDRRLLDIGQDARRSARIAQSSFGQLLVDRRQGEGVDSRVGSAACGELCLDERQSGRSHACSSAGCLHQFLMDCGQGARSCARFVQLALARLVLARCQRARAGNCVGWRGYRVIRLDPCQVSRIGPRVAHGSGARHFLARRQVDRSDERSPRIIGHWCRLDRGQDARPRANIVQGGIEWLFLDAGEGAHIYACVATCGGVRFGLDGRQDAHDRPHFVGDGIKRYFLGAG